MVLRCRAGSLVLRVDDLVVARAFSTHNLLAISSFAKCFWRMSASCRSGVGGVTGEERTRWGSVLSTAGRNCCNYTVHGWSMWGARKEEMTPQRVAENEIERVEAQTMVSALESKNRIKDGIVRFQITRSSWHELIWWDCFFFFKKASFVCLFSFHTIDSIHGRQWPKKTTFRQRSMTVIFKKSVLFLKSCFPLHWRGPLKSCCCGTKHFSHVMTRMSDLRLFFWL